MGMSALVASPRAEYCISLSGLVELSELVTMCQSEQTSADLSTSPAHCAARAVLRWPRPLYLAVDRYSRPDRYQSTTRTSSYRPKHRAISTAGFPRSIRHTRSCCKRREHTQCLATRSVVAITTKTESGCGKEALCLIWTSPEYEYSAWGTAFAQYE